MSSYDLQSVKLPLLTGRALRLFANAVAGGPTKALLVPKLLQDAGIPKLHETRLDEVPTLLPLIPVEEKAGEYKPPTISLDAMAPARPLPLRTVHDFATAYRNGDITPLAVAERVLDAIAASDRGNHPLRAIIALEREDVLKQAKAATERIQDGRPLSVLDGVPVAIKDEVDMVPYPTKVGTKVLGQKPAAQDATAVARLRAAGAILIGKANMHEIGINPTGHNLHYGPARNPHNLDYDTGGSSSGPAAATAAGLCPVSLGADGGGSIRVPAAHCGLVGLKATFGRISEKGAAPLCWSVAHVGPIGTSAADVALAYSLMAGPDTHDQNTLVQPAVTLDNWQQTDLTGIRMGIFPDWFNHAAPEIVTANQQMVDAFVKMGAQVVEIDIPHLDLIRIAHALTILSEMASSMKNLGIDPKAFAPATRINLLIGGEFGAADYVKAQRVRTKALQIFDEIYEQVDVIVTPTTALTAPEIVPASLSDGISDLSTVTEIMRFIFPSNLTGHPAVSFPVGYDGKGLPIGMQVIGRHWEEAMLLRFAFAAEQVVERKRPSLYFDLLA